MIVVNDGSADGSGPLLDTLAAERPWLTVVHHERNGGYGKALISGFTAARHEWIFYTDGDAQYDAREAAEARAASPRTTSTSCRVTRSVAATRGTAR